MMNRNKTFVRRISNASIKGLAGVPVMPSGRSRSPFVAAGFGKIRLRDVCQSEKSDLRQALADLSERNPSASNCFLPVLLWHDRCTIGIATIEEEGGV